MSPLYILHVAIKKNGTPLVKILNVRPRSSAFQTGEEDRERERERESLRRRDAREKRKKKGRKWILTELRNFQPTMRVRSRAGHARI